MKSTLSIKDLSVAKELDGKAMATVRGGTSDQANGTNQSNVLAAYAPMAVANGSVFGGSGPVNIQATSNVHQTADNYSTSENYKDYFMGVGIPGYDA